MSSILKALKKLENESLRETVRETGRPSGKRGEGAGSRRFLRAAVIAAIAFLSLAGGLIFFRIGPQAGRDFSPAVLGEGRVEARPGASQKEAGTPPSDKKIRPRSEEPLPRHPKAAPRRNPLGSQSLRKASASADSDSSGFGSPSSRVRRKAPRMTVRNGSTELELQAVAWSSDPGGRLAVINGQVLREGGSIEGCIVTDIAEDEVSLQNGARRWKLKFQRR